MFLKILCLGVHNLWISICLCWTLNYLFVFFLLFFFNNLNLTSINPSPYLAPRTKGLGPRDLWRFATSVLWKHIYTYNLSILPYYTLMYFLLNNMLCCVLRGFYCVLDFGWPWLWCLIVLIKDGWMISGVFNLFQDCMFYQVLNSIGREVVPLRDSFTSCRPAPSIKSTNTVLCTYSLTYPGMNVTTCNIFLHKMWLYLCHKSECFWNSQ